VVNLHTIKPIDRKALVEAAEKCGAVVTAEEHQLMGGMGSAVAEVLAEEYPVPVKMVGIKDSFGESGQPQALMKAYGLTSDDVVKAVKAVLQRKRQL
jgi:transketolase